MAEHEYTGTIAASPDVVFGYLADVANLPSYLPLMTAARPTGPGQVEMDSVVNGQAHTLAAWFRPDAAARTIAWGSARTDEYEGRLVVRADGDGSAVDFRLVTPRDHTLEPYLRAAETFLANALETR